MAERKPNIVILGAGFGGLFAARGLARSDANITVIDRNNYHLFQPLLYQVAGAGLAPSDVAWPIRALLSGQENTRVVMAEIADIDLNRRQVLTHHGTQDFDYLVVATGSVTSWFGHDDWQQQAPGLKSLADATAIRQRVLAAFERAELADSEAEQQRLLTFAVVGGGPTGVELAGNLAELGKQIMRRDFRHIRADTMRVVLIEGQDQLLGGFPDALGQYTENALTRLGVEVITGHQVEQIENGRIRAGDFSVDGNMVLWCAGVTATPAAEWLGVATEAGGRIRVDSDLHVPGLKNVFAIGDVALCECEDGEPLPGLAPVAKQQGQHVARVLRAAMAGKPPPKPFRYRDYGHLATIGRGKAVADFGFFKSRGLLTWWLWGFVHIFYLIGRRSRVTVIIKWLWEYLNYERGSRLILQRDPDGD